MVSYNQWLEAPYQEGLAENDHFVAWAEKEGYDLSHPDQAKWANSEYENYLEVMADDWAEARNYAIQDLLID